MKYFGNVIPGSSRDLLQHAAQPSGGRPRHKAGVTALLFLFTPLTANAFSLGWPIDCKLDESCFIQNFVEHGGNKDYACGEATFPGLTGTDIRVRSLSAMRAGVTVRAAADGTVLGIRDGVDDIERTNDMPKLTERECGNGVQIQHEGGYRTQYCHMRKGSINVKTGQQVKAGDALGLVGLSGETQFPHLNFNVLRGTQPLDPFTSAPASMSCNPNGAAITRQLWATPIAYQPTALLNDGVTDTTPKREAMLNQPVMKTSLPANAPALIYWAELMNLRAGDMLVMSITSPDGSSYAEDHTTLDKNKAAYFKFIGKKNSAGKLAAGTYRTRLTVMRGSTAAIDIVREITVQ